jgi:hypothetical protein
LFGAHFRLRLVDMARRTRRRLAGSELGTLRPDWRPLIELAPDEVPDFMWMFRDFLEDGIVVEAYKHSWTRQYVHLDSDGRGYVFLGGASRSSYEEVDPQALFAEALQGYDSRASIVRQNDWVDGDRITWARSATRHRVPRAQTLFAIQHAGVCFGGGVGRNGEPRLYFFGDDEEEQPLEIVGYENEAGDLLVVHSMSLRRRFEDKYTEALRWQK